MNYRMFAKSLPGRKYASKGWCCQDSSDKGTFGSVQAIAIADGHGSSDCFRSEIGSRIAIDTAFCQIEKYCQDINEDLDTSVQFSETGIKGFKHGVWQEWRKAVKNDWEERLKKQQFLGENEIRFESVSEKYKKRYTSQNKEVVEKYLYAAYGTTLLFAVAIDTQLLILQIGDGSCVVLQKNGEFRVPVPDDEGNFLNVTVSLCEEEANFKIRHTVIDRNPDSPTTPIAVFLSSDGVDDCYPYIHNERYLYKLYTIILENILEVGFEETETEIIENLLPGMSAKSSQDDISLAYFIIEDIEILKNVYDEMKFNNLVYKDEV